jgi:hypothetical protein
MKQSIVHLIIANSEVKMLIKIGGYIINTEAISYINLNLKGSKVLINLIADEGYISFCGEEAEVLRWYFNHPTSDVIDIKNFKEG